MRCGNCGWPNDDNETLCTKCNQSLKLFTPTAKYIPKFESYYAIEAICCNCGHWQAINEIIKYTCPKCQNKHIQLQTISKSRLEAKCPECGYCTHDDIAFCPFCGIELRRCICLLPEDHWAVALPAVHDCLPPLTADYIVLHSLNNEYYLCQNRKSLKFGVVNSENVLMTDLKYDEIRPFCKCYLPGTHRSICGAFYKDGNEVGFLVEDSAHQISEYIRWPHDIYYRRCRYS